MFACVPIMGWFWNSPASQSRVQSQSKFWNSPPTLCESFKFNSIRFGIVSNDSASLCGSSHSSSDQKEKEGNCNLSWWGPNSNNWKKPQMRHWLKKIVECLFSQIISFDKTHMMKKKLNFWIQLCQNNVERLVFRNQLCICRQKKTFICLFCCSKSQTAHELWWNFRCHFVRRVSVDTTKHLQSPNFQILIVKWWQIYAPSLFRTSLPVQVACSDAHWSQKCQSGWMLVQPHSDLFRIVSMPFLTSQHPNFRPCGGS